MIIAIHNSQQVIQVIGVNNYSISSKSITSTLFELAAQYPQETLVWCYEEAFPNLNTQQIETLLPHDKMMISFNPNEDEFISSKYGYVDHAAILKINKKVRFFTWQQSSYVGAAKAILFNTIKNQVDNNEKSLDYFLVSLAFRAMPNGLFCYSEPKLLLKEVAPQRQSSSPSALFRFVKEQRGLKWLLFLLFSIFLFERKLEIMAFIKSLKYQQLHWNKETLSSLEVSVSNSKPIHKEIDVIVPTIGRPEHVKNVLLDLKEQTLLPKKVIVVEQKPEPGSTSDLQFLQTEVWPFEIDHTFTHTPGACNARNVALSKVNSEWVFMCDDDNRFPPDLIEKVFENVEKYGIDVLLTAYPQKDEVSDFNIIHQTTIFGSGNAFFKTAFLKKINFDAQYEFCYGEDFDFGMQLRNQGADVIYFPDIKILHLKAPMGGFRTKPILKWSQEPIQPIPSPTIVLNYLKYRTTEQLKGYQLIYFLKRWKADKNINIFSYYKKFSKHWKVSLHWAKKWQHEN